MRIIRVFVAISFMIITSIHAYAQTKEANNAQIESYYASPNSRMNKSDSLFLFNTSQLNLPFAYRGAAKSIPSIVDHSTSQYLRPIFYQVALECGQAGGIAYTFTYEMNRVRNLSSNNISNQYPTHFAWNFKNGGAGSGVNCLETWDVLRMAGTPNVPQWGGTLSFGGSKRWISGYNNYYQAMKNRVYETYSIPVNTIEGLQTLKYWLYDHLEDSPEGGIANFYSTYVSNGASFITLPAGTPEGGMKVITAFSSYVNHCQTIVGFNDSIRYDYNGDGMYTNNVDINNDGAIDMRDWEIGGVKFTNSFGTDFANNGFCYMMYKVLAETPANGGVWNNQVFVIKVKEEYDPLATFKVSLTHTSRGKINVIAGVSSNLSSTIPEKMMNFSVFNYQGGDFYMQGDTGELAKTIELGLDISPLLNEITAGTPAKFFFQVVENDPSNVSSGQINALSLMDYTSGTLVETASTSINVALINNSTTTMSVVATPNHQKPIISNLTLPAAEAFELYQQQLNATNGTPPYHWRFKMGYDMNEGTASFPMVTQQLVNMSATYNGSATKTLPFEFPFFGKKYDKIVIYTGGYIEFRNNIYSWPFLVSNDLLLKSHELIAPFKEDLVMNSGDGIWFESMPTHAIVRWKMSVNGQSGTQVNVALKLYPNGDVEFFYGNINVNSAQNWKACISRGNAKDFVVPAISSSFITNTNERKVFFDNYEYPQMLSLSDDGLLSGTPTEYYSNLPLKIEVIDNNDLVNEKTLPFSTTFTNRVVVVSHTEHVGGDNVVNNGELVNVDLEIRNIDTTAVTNAQIIASSTDPYITFTDNTEYFGYIGAGNTYNLSNAIKFQVSADIPNEHPIHIKIETQCDGLPSSTNITIVAYSSNVEFVSASVQDGNDNTLNSNEIDTIMVTIKNIGGSTINHLNGLLTTSEPNITFIQSLDTLSTLAPFSSTTLRYIVSLNNSFEDGRMNDFLLQLTAENFNKTLSFSLFSGGTLEDFESGDFTVFPWTQSLIPWTIRSDSAYEGSSVARSGMVTHNEYSTMSLTEEVLIPGNISFYKKVSCENDASNNWDYLSFSIDGTEKERWDGEVGWSQSSYPVTAGNHTFTWKYNKDVSVNTGFDAAWVDYILFPMFGSSNPNCLVAPDSVHKYLFPTETDSFKFYLMNTASGIATYQVQIVDLDGYNVPWLMPLYNTGSLNSNESDTIPVGVIPNNMIPGEYYAAINVSYSNGTQFTIPVQLTVLLDAGVANNQKENDIAIYPNPAKERVVFQIPSELAKNATISIFSFTGQLIEKINNSILVNDKNEYIWQPKGISAGVYFYELNSGSVVKRGKITLIP